MSNDEKLQDAIATLDMAVNSLDHAIGILAVYQNRRIKSNNLYIQDLRNQLVLRMTNLEDLIAVGSIPTI